MHRKLIADIVEKGKSADMEMLKTIMVEMLDDIKVYNPHEYKEIEYKMYTMVHGDHLDEELAKHWVDSMKNDDGSMGAHWTVEQTSQYAGKHDKWDWFAAMNMAWSDFYNPKFSTEDYVFIATRFIDDRDVPSGKTLRYYWFVVKC